MSVSEPLVSIVWYGKNRLPWIEKEIGALLRPGDTSLQLIVEDGGSTDGTLEWIRRLAEHDKRVDVVSRNAASPGEALLRALRRCTGRYIAICPRHALLIPSTLELAVQTLERSPDAGAVACRDLLVDAAGDPAPVAFDLVMTLFTSLRIAPSGGVIRRSALMESGLMRDDWRMGCVAFELWCRLVMDHEVAAVDSVMVDGKAGHEAGDFTYDADQLVGDHLRYVASLFGTDNLFDDSDDIALKFEAMANQLGVLREELGAPARHALDHAALELAKDIVSRARYDSRVRRSFARWKQMWHLPDTLEALSRSCTPARPGWTASVAAMARVIAVCGQIFCWPIVRAALRSPSRKLDNQAIRGLPALFAKLYAMQAEWYNGRGQVASAVANWRLAEPLGDAMLDSMAVQSELKRPGATEASLADVHKRWVARHIGSTLRVDDIDLPRWDGKRKIRVGYHCAFMHNDTIRYMMAKVLQAHDRSRFEIFCYSPFPPHPEAARGFDVIRDTSTTEDDPERVMFHKHPMLSHESFCQMVRADRIDVLVELTGFSPGHRFAAMAGRCAPVQVSFLNHTASSQVPNVDYILADEICLPEEGGFQADYSEKIYRLPGCFFCFDYRGSSYPEIVPPPSLPKGYVTFGCFGFGGKLNGQLLRLWAQLLREVPSSRLHIQSVQIKNERARAFLAERFSSFGIAPERLTLANGVDRQSLLDVYADIDICLDTLPYNGGNCTAEALWHGVPVVTLKGDRFASRYGASLVAAAGCADLAADSPEQYIAIAKQLANDPARLADLRRHLRDMSIDHGLGDSVRFARRLEDAYVDMLSRVGTAPTVVESVSERPRERVHE